MVCRMLSWKYRQSTQFGIVKLAEHVLFRIVQRGCFPQEIRSLKANMKVERDSRILQYRPFLDEGGLIRANRRLHLSDLEEDRKHPINLAHHHITALHLRYIHENHMHLGVEGCVAFARRRFAIIACRRVLRTIKNRCTICRRFDTPSGAEVSPPLPLDRVTLQRPICVVGVDHVGPSVAKTAENNKKVWILLFVCATTRAVN